MFKTNNNLKLKLQKSPVRKKNGGVFDVGKIEGEKFCFDIIIDNMRFSGVWYLGGEEKQNEILEKIKNGISNANIEKLCEMEKIK